MSQVPPLAIDPGRSFSPIRAFVVDDHPITRFGLAQVFEAEPGIEFVGEAEDPAVAPRALDVHQPNVVIVDLIYPHGTGLDLIRETSRRPEGCKVIVYTAVNTDGYPERCLQAGAAAFVSKSEPVARLVHAVRLVHEGRVYLSEERAGSVLSKLLGSKADPSASPVDRLSEGEFQVFHLMGQGMSNRQIALALHRSVRTVETYRSRIKRKVGADNATQLAQLAARHTRSE